MGTPTLPSQRLSRLENGSNSTGSSSSDDTHKINSTFYSRRRCTNILPLLVLLVVLAEIAFLGKFDMGKNADLVNSWADSFYQFTTGNDEPGLGFLAGLVNPGFDPDSCEAWLEKEDSVDYSRNFSIQPIVVHGGDQDFKTCDVGCKFGDDSSAKADAAFGIQNEASSVHRSMESAQYYSENDITAARRRGFDVVMTTSLSSDVPVGYFSWAEYDIMAPVPPKTENALAAAFISNCGARNFRLQALEALEKAKIKIDSYGSCHRNHDGKVDKVQTLKRYKFSLAFENSNEEDYVTEKFFQSLVAGSVPVVVGAPNIQEFAPAPGSILHIKELSDADKVAETMRYLSQDVHAFNETLRWKYEGPSDSFKALVDMAAVHSSCRLCIFLATNIREKEEKTPIFKKRPCRCDRGSQTVYHMYVRERGRFDKTSIFLRSNNLTIAALESAILLKFKSLNHVPVWKGERPESIKGGNELKVYRVYPLGMTQRQALYNFKFEDNAEFQKHIESHPCAKFEVIFV